jgi:hypothetical protein
LDILLTGLLELVLLLLDLKLVVSQFILKDGKVWLALAYNEPVHLLSAIFTLVGFFKAWRGHFLVIHLVEVLIILTLIEG